MLKHLFLIIFLFICFKGFSQCVPNTIYQDSTGNIWPKTGFSDGNIGQYYYNFWDMKAPTTLIEAAQGDTAFVTVDTFGSIIYIGDWPVDSVVTIDIHNLPPGISVDCTLPNCTYEGGDIGCANIQGYPTSPGYYNLAIVTNLYTHGVVSITVGGVPLTIPVELDYFSVTGTYDTVSRYSIQINEATSIYNHIAHNETQIINDNQNITMIIPSNTIQKCNINLINSVGQIIVKKKVLLSYGNNTIKLDNINYKGIYIANIQKLGIHESQYIKFYK